ncbi:hypothetical protein CsatB_006690 [Cannabis sativa]
MGEGSSAAQSIRGMVGAIFSSGLTGRCFEIVEVDVVSMEIGVGMKFRWGTVMCINKEQPLAAMEFVQMEMLILIVVVITVMHLWKIIMKAHLHLKGEKIIIGFGF